MGSFFSSRKKHDDGQNAHSKGRTQITQKDEAVLELKRMRDRLRKYREGLFNIVTRETELARELINTNQKRKAVLILKKKKLQESLAEKAQGQLYNIETMLTQIETAALNQQIFQAMKVGQATLAKLQSEMSVEDIEDLMEDTMESVQAQERLSNTLATSLTPEESSSVEEEVERMLQEMKMEELQEEGKGQDEAKVAKAKEQVSNSVVTADSIDESATITEAIESLPEPPSKPLEPIPVAVDSKESTLLENTELQAEKRTRVERAKQKQQGEVITKEKEVVLG